MADEENYGASMVVEDILWLRHTEVIVKSDNEASLQTFARHILHAVRIKVSCAVRTGADVGVESQTAPLRVSGRCL